MRLEHGCFNHVSSLNNQLITRKRSWSKVFFSTVMKRSMLISGSTRNWSNERFSFVEHPWLFQSSQEFLSYTKISFHPQMHELACHSEEIPFSSCCFLYAWCISFSYVTLYLFFNFEWRKLYKKVSFLFWNDSSLESAEVICWINVAVCALLI